MKRVLIDRKAMEGSPSTSMTLEIGSLPLGSSIWIAFLVLYYSILDVLYFHPFAWPVMPKIPQHYQGEVSLV
jgi:hypothetical protein